MILNNYRDSRDRFATSITFEIENFINHDFSTALLFTINEIFNENEQTNIFMIFYTFQLNINENDFIFKQKKSLMIMLRNVLSIIINQKIQKHQINKKIFIDFIANIIFIFFFDSQKTSRRKNKLF